MNLLEPLVMKKITILGTTGSGKTTFLEALFGNIEKNDVARRIFREIGNNLDFTPLKYNNFTSSTTTISLNVVNSVLILTRFNKVILKKYDQIETLDFESIDSVFQVIMNDLPGQDRFDFMQDIVIKGSDLVIIMADGTNISSLEKIVHYLEMVQMEEVRKNRNIPIIIFINKSDLRDKGVYLGKETAERIVFSSIVDRELVFYETTNLDANCYELPLTIIFNYLAMQAYS
ncbi:MAG: GTP-binding protein [Candidatus Heimdallarchaeota archaeon]|nr:GTP-binding protein [Candidatus Heimdallarchaeota archaeon]MCG3257731.1 GTP-binding protein [Candidatus Heimdallarchaeota archaeon]MCK4612782.1 GTP-binding protein [Candidatus Heimdallarchaeota archaeon]